MLSLAETDPLAIASIRAIRAGDLATGAELNWVSPWDHLAPLDAARRSGASELAEWLVARGAKPAKS